MSDDSFSPEDIRESFPDVSFTVWAKIHSLPIHRVLCVGCKKMVLTSRPFTLEHPKTSSIIVGLTTDNNGQHDCEKELGLRIARLVTNKQLNINSDGGIL